MLKQLPQSQQGGLYKMKKSYVITFLVLVLIAIIIIVVINRNKKKKEIESINKAIEDNVDLTGDPQEGLTDKTDPAKADTTNWSQADKDLANTLALQINKALGFLWDDDEEAVYDAVRRSKNQRLWALVAKTFYDNEGLSLTNFLDRHMSTAEKNLVLTYINQLPE